MPTFQIKVIFISPDNSDAGILETDDPSRALDALRRPWTLVEADSLEEFTKEARKDCGEEPDPDYYWERTTIKCSQEPGHTIHFYSRDSYYINPDNRDLLRSWGFDIPANCVYIRDCP